MQRQSQPRALPHYSGLVQVANGGPHFPVRIGLALHGEAPEEGEATEDTGTEEGGLEEEGGLGAALGELGGEEESVPEEDLGSEEIIEE